MSFKKTKIFVAVAIVVFIFAVGNIVLFGNLSKEKVVVINNQTNLTIAPVADVKKNVTKQNTTTDVVVTPMQNPMPNPPMRTRAS